MEILTDILQWLIPSGALSSVVLWFMNRTSRELRTTKEIHDTYKVMYDDLRVTLMEIKNENERLYKRTGRLERIVSKAPSCKYYRTCPVKYELQQQENPVDIDEDVRTRLSYNIRDPGDGDGKDTKRDVSAGDVTDRPP